MTRPMKIMLIALCILFGLIFGWKIFMGIMMKRYFASQTAPTVTVTTMQVPALAWQPKIKAPGSLRAIKGVNVTPAAGGNVTFVYFKPGAMVKEGDLLVQLEAGVEVARLHSLQAQAELAKITFHRDVAQWDAKAISKQTVDTDEQNYKSAVALVAQQQALVNYKTVRAPFTGRLGINLVNPGQWLNPGDKIVSLQAVHPIYVDFNLPQQSIAQIKVGQTVNLKTDTYPDKQFSGKITTIDPAVDPGTRNVVVEATIDNPQGELVPGMFARVEVNIGEPKKYLTVPQTAISFNPYGDIVYIVTEDNTSKKDEKKSLVVHQAFVETGETRGDQVTVVKGLKLNDVIVTSGQVKLKNGSHIVANNSVLPANNPDPVILNE